MSIETLSIVIGGKACNARCPFCISAMTGFDELSPINDPIDEVNFRKACRFAQMNSATTVLMTGKGEPTLFPEQINQFLGLLEEWDFPFIELQTNGLALGRLAAKGESGIKGLNQNLLQSWRKRGINTLALSVVGVYSKLNSDIYHPDYPDLTRTIEFLHESRFTIRLSVMLMDSNFDLVPNMLEFCRRLGVEQSTFRPIRKPENSQDDKAAKFVEEHGLTSEQEAQVFGSIRKQGKKLRTLKHGAEIYDVDGQNVCLTDCLTISPETDDIRTLIFYADGLLTYDWQHKGAILLGGRSTKV